MNKFYGFLSPKVRNHLRKHASDSYRESVLTLYVVVQLYHITNSDFSLNPTRINVKLDFFLIKKLINGIHFFDDFQVNFP